MRFFHWGADVPPLIVISIEVLSRLDQLPDGGYILWNEECAGFIARAGRFIMDARPVGGVVS